MLTLMLDAEKAFKEVVMSFITLKSFLKLDLKLVS